MSKRFLIIGVQGSGKGTQAKLLSQKYGIPHISTGDLLRSASRSTDPKYTSLKSFLSQGNLVPDAEVIPLFQERFSQSDAKVGYILDGFPRTLSQARSLSEMLSSSKSSLDAVIILDLDIEILFDRLLNRETCSVCGAIYHTKNKPSQINGVCDICHSPLTRRDDDTDEGSIRARIESYKNETIPIIDYYEKRGITIHIDASQTIQAVSEEIYSKLGPMI